MTVAAAIAVESPERSGPAQSQVRERALAAESFQSKWQAQLASLGSEARALTAQQGSGDDLLEEAQDELATSGSNVLPAGIALPLKIGQTQSGADDRTSADRSSSLVAGRNTTNGTGVQANRSSVRQGIDMNSVDVGRQQAGGPSSVSNRAFKNESANTVSTTKSPQRKSSEAGSLAASTMMPLPLSPAMNIVEARTRSVRADIGSTSLSVKGSNDFTAETMSGSSFDDSHLVAAHGSDVPAGIPSSVGVESGATRGGQAEDSLDAQKGYAVNANGTTQASEAARPDLRMHADPFTRSLETNSTLSATTGASTISPQAVAAGSAPAASIQSGFEFNQTPAAEPNKANAGLSESSSASLHGARKSAQGVNPIADRSGTVQVPFTAAAGDAALIGRDSASAQTQSNPTSGHSPSASEAPLRETFAALDADVAPGAPTWTHANPQQAEAGFQDPALGWIGVRADRNGGGVHVALVPGSAEAAQELGTHIDGLNAYLTAQRTPVESLAMAAPEGGASNHGTQQGGDHGRGQGAEQGMRQGGQQGSGQNAEQQRFGDSAKAIHSFERSATSDASVQPVGLEIAAPIERREGVSISVVA